MTYKAQTKTVKHSNTDISKLHNLRKNGVYFCKWTTDGATIEFASRYGYLRYKELEHTTLAMTEEQ